MVIYVYVYFHYISTSILLRRIELHAERWVKHQNLWGNYTQADLHKVAAHIIIAMYNSYDCES